MGLSISRRPKAPRLIDKKKHEAYTLEQGDEHCGENRIKYHRSENVKATIKRGGGTMPKEVHVMIKKLDHARDLPLPRYMSEEASGMDIFAAVESEIVLEPGKFALVPAGIMMAIPCGFEAQVRPRSGLALKHGITVLNAPGTIDADYRGEIKVLLINLGPNDYTIGRGERIAQLVIHALPAVRLVQTEELPPSLRGDGGFGHTGAF